MKIDQKIGWTRSTIAAVLIVIAMGLFFRLSAFWPVASPEKIQKLAEDAVYQQIKEQLLSSINSQAPNLDNQAKNELLARRMEEVIQTDRDQFNLTVQQFKSEIEAEIQNGRDGTRYLLESDPYYYLFLVKYILKEGWFTGQFKSGKFFDPLRIAPDGEWDWITLHPYVGVVMYRLISVFTKIDLIHALAAVPLFLVAISVFLFFILCAFLDISLFPSFLGAVFFVLAPMYIQRSAFGWFDTDVYNFIFPISIFILFYQGLSGTKRSQIFIVIAGIVSAFYSYFWMGWPFIVLIVSASCVMLEILNYWFKFEMKRGLYFWRAVEYSAVALLAANIFMTPIGFVGLVRDDIRGVLQFIRADFDVWPNIFVLLGETRPGTVSKIIFLTSNPLNFIVVILGVVSFIKLFRTADQKRGLLIHYVPIIMYAIAVFILSLGAERFSLFLVTPFAVFAALGIEALLSFFAKLFLEVKETVRQWLMPILCGFIAIIFSCSSFVYAYASSLNLKPIMNHTWHDTLKEIDERTPPESIVNSWWDPGYFIISIAERRAIGDGGSPHFHQNYWMARALISGDEKQAAGILRMLDTSANRAGEWVQTKLGLDEGAHLIANIVTLSREEAKRALRQYFNEEDSEQLLVMIHGAKEPPPAYLLLYNQIVEMNAALTMVANWDFGRAEVIQRTRRSKKLGDYMQKVFAASGEVWRYNPEAFLLKKEENKVFFINGVSIDMTTMDTVIDVPKEKVHVQPSSLFYMENGEFIEKKFEGSNLDVACLLIRNGDKMSTVLANPNLIKSMLFRLYYLKGEGLKIFQPFINRSDADTKTTLRVFKIDWDKLKEHDFYTKMTINKD